MIAIYFLILVAIFFIFYLVFKAIRFKDDQQPVSQTNVGIDIDIEKAAENLKSAVQCKTISNFDQDKVDWSEFQKFEQFLEETYSRSFEVFEKLDTNAKGLVFRWPGKNISLSPILLLAHCDVVPIEVGTEKDWDYPPFSGEIAEGYVWGRGSMDIKVQLVSYFEAAEMLISEKFVPERDIYFALGFDEEVGGSNGADLIAQYFKSKNIKFDCVIDEGAVVMTGGLHPKLKDIPIATIGIAEKGMCNIQLIAKSAGGHSSTPPKHSSLGVIAKAISRLENNKMNPKLCEPVKMTFSKVGRKMPFWERLLFSNISILKTLIFNTFKKDSTLDALIRTTTAATMCAAANAANILPQVSTATINFRILPGDTIEDVIKHVKQHVDDLGIEVSPLIASNPSKTSNTDSEAFGKLSASIQSAFPEATIVPILLSGGTDARKYEIVSDNVYRFIPNYMAEDDFKRLHSTNERISLENLKTAIRFFKQFMENYR
jgi:carboxypeptidase PM20D1